MFNCCDIFEQMRLQKYYSKKRECEGCGKIALLNPILALCPECTKKEIEYLNHYIENKIKDKEEEKKKVMFPKQKIKQKKHRKIKLSA